MPGQDLLSQLADRRLRAEVGAEHIDLCAHPADGPDLSDCGGGTGLAAGHNGQIGASAS
jgi:hypothetical protein